MSNARCNPLVAPLFFYLKTFSTVNYFLNQFTSLKYFYQGTLQVKGEKFMQTAITYLQRCLQIPSVNPMDGEEAVARYVYAVLVDHQISTEWIEVSPKRICLVATVPASEDVSRPAVLGLSGHLDTVPVQEDGWTKDPYGGEIEDGRIYGRGASDMKSGVMAMVQALIQYRERQERPNTIKLLITSDEEN